MHARPAIVYDSISAGPATSFAAEPVATKMPAPITAPTPSDVSVTGPNTRLRRCSPAISASSVSSDFLAQSCFQLIAVGLRAEADLTREREEHHRGSVISTRIASAEF